ncbi:MAG: hypothetical protein K0S23_2734 [Fluviicola sp.]|jgi:hypothetical protein|nr:hypothetical protein [Fluviicola sp.]
MNKLITILSIVVLISCAQNESKVKNQLFKNTRRLILKCYRLFRESTQLNLIKTL